VTQSLYEQRLPASAEAILAAGFSAVVDATFLLSSHRAVMAALAHRCGVPLVILDCRVSPLLARRRLQARQRQGGDPSEANGSVLNRQLQMQQPFTAEEWPRVLSVDTTKTINFALFWSQLQGMLANPLGAL